MIYEYFFFYFFSSDHFLFCVMGQWIDGQGANSEVGKGNASSMTPNTTNSSLQTCAGSLLYGPLMPIRKLFVSRAIGSDG